MIAGIHLGNYIFSTFTKGPNIFTESSSIVFGFLIHTFISGPIVYRIIIPEAGLNFSFNWKPILLAISLFCLIRIILFTVEKIRTKLN